MARPDPTLDACFAALADPTRRAMLDRLARGPATLGELAAPHASSLPTMLGHLRKLEAAGLVTSRKSGRQRVCLLAPGAFRPATDWLSAQRALWTARLDALERYATALSQDMQE